MNLGVVKKVIFFIKEIGAHGLEQGVVVGTWTLGPVPPPLLCLPPGPQFLYA